MHYSVVGVHDCRLFVYPSVLIVPDCDSPVDDKANFLRATAATAVARLIAIAILSVCHTGGSVKNGAS